VAVALATLAALAVLAAPGPAAARGAQDPGLDPEPSRVATLRVAEPRLDRGRTVVAEGSGWPGNTIVAVELCGQEAANGSADCDITTSRSISTYPDGRLHAELLVTAPPSPCPCVLRAFVPGGTLAVSVPVEIAGHPIEAVVAPSPAAERRLDVTAVRVRTVGVGFWSRTREVTVEVANGGDVALPPGAVKVRWGRGEGVDRFVAVPGVPALGPGESATVTGRFDLDGFTFGTFRVQAGPSGTAGRAAEATTTAPIAEIVVPLALLLLLVGGLVARRFRRRRRERPSGADEPREADGSGGAGEDGDPGGDGREDAVGVGDVDRADPDSDPAPAPFAGVGSDARVGLRRGLSVGLVAGVLALGACSSRTGGDRAGDGDLCASLRQADTGNAIGGEELGPLVRSIGVLAEVEQPPEELAAALRALRNAWAAQPDAHDLPDLDFGDDGYTTAYQAAYRLRFTPNLRRAAAVVEQYGSRECAIAPSGKLELPESRAGEQAAPSASLPDRPLDGVELRFDDSDFSAYQLPELDIPTVTFDRDLGEFSVNGPAAATPDLADREGSVGPSERPSRPTRPPRPTTTTTQPEAGEDPAG